jgi:hypothetical protein
MKRFVVIIVASILLTGCPPMDRVLRSRDIEVIKAGKAVDNQAESLLSSDRDVDEFSLRVTEVLNEQGFYLAYSSASWGLLPLTGHTQNMGYKTLNTEHVSCSVIVSKTEFTARFVEYEEELKSGRYVTSSEDKAQIARATKALIALAKSSFNERAIHVSISNNK